MYRGLSHTANIKLPAGLAKHGHRGEVSFCFVVVVVCFGVVFFFFSEVSLPGRRCTVHSSAVVIGSVFVAYLGHS